MAGISGEIYGFADATRERVVGKFRGDRAVVVGRASETVQTVVFKSLLRDSGKAGCGCDVGLDTTI